MEQVLKEVGFKESPGDPALFYKLTIKGLQILLSWLDDIVMPAFTKQEFANIKKSLTTKLECRVLREPKSFLFVQIIRDRQARTKINRPKLVEEVLTVVNMYAGTSTTPDHWGLPLGKVQDSRQNTLSLTMLFWK